MTSSTKDLSFEEAFKRVEEILERLNVDTIPLDQSVMLYEEASKLVEQCNRHLAEAESKIALLSKGKQGELILNSAGEPASEPFSPSHSG